MINDRFHRVRVEQSPNAVSRSMANTVRYLAKRLAAVAFCAVLATACANGQVVDFNRDIRPILAENCWVCHGHDAGTREADLRLDIREEAIDYGAIVPGDVESSSLLERVESDDPEWVMPPPHSRKQLSDADRQLLRRWIEQGAPYDVHWAYAEIQRPTIPQTAPDVTVHNPIDAFVAAALQQRGLSQSPVAEKHLLLRRLYLDLTGLPPTPQAIKAFLNDNRPSAVERVIDELLASPQFGERMAPMWLDVVRYADTVGYHGDQNQNAFAYRDWVIDALNQNMPFDQFTIEQIAGDLLPAPTAETLTATCFNRLNMMTREGGAQPEEYLAKYAADRVRTIGTAWLGATIGCAECHDHKYDPFTMVDFYSLAAYFADLKQWGVYQDYEYTPNPDLRGWSNDHPFPPEIEVEVPYLKARRERLLSERNQMAAAISKRSAESDASQAAWQQWRTSVHHFLEAAPSGWQPLSPHVDLADGWASGRLVSDPPHGEIPADSTVPFVQVDADQPNKLRLIISAEQVPDDLAWNAMRLSFLPDPACEDHLFPSKTNAASMRITWERVLADGTTRQPIAVHFADAGAKHHRYSNGFEIMGVQGGWLVPNGLQRVDSTWVFDQSVSLESGQSLLVTIDGNRAGRIAIAATPLIPSFVDGVPSGALHPDALQWLSDDAAAPVVLAAGGGEVSDLPDAVARMRALIPGVASGNEIGELRRIEREILLCREGRWPVMVTESRQPVETRVLPRGNWQDLSGAVVTPQTPSFLPSTAVDASKTRLNRLDLAEWLVADANPLTARVQVNRYWKHFFGRGLSAVADDFGIQGEYPSHPDLLDWLAVEFRESGWDVKHLVRLIVTSATYQQSAEPRATSREVDPENRWLTHQNARRLEAESIRDMSLSASGLLNLERGGPPIFPYQPDNYYAHLQFPDRRYRHQSDERQYRRAVYMHWQRTFLHPMLANFDAPPREECTGMRPEANTPQQSLTLLNDPTFVEAAKALAILLIRESESDSSRLDSAFLRVLGRPPTHDERQPLLEFLARQRDHWGQNPDAAGELTAVGLLPPPAEIESGELASWISVTRVLLNLHETITRY